MKRTAFNVIMSIFLILAGLVTQACGAWGVIECVALGRIDGKFNETLDKLTKLEEAIGKLRDTEDKYYAGVSAIYTGELELAKGHSVVSNGEAVLKKGRLKVAEAQAKYDKAAAQLADAKKEITAAEAKMDAARDDYEKGQETLETAETLMPLLNTYIKIRNGISIIPGIKSTQQWYESRVIPAGAKLGVTLPPDVKDFEPFMNNYIAEGKAQLAKYEEAQLKLEESKQKVADAEAQLAEAKTVLDESKDKLNAGQREIDKANDKLSYAAAQIAKGKQTLEEYDKAVGMLGEGLKEFLNLEPVYDRSGNVAVKGIMQRLGDDFDCYLHNENGDVLALHNGEPRLDYDKCMQICTAFREYVADYVEDVNGEVTVRFILDGAIIAAGLLAVVTAILALCGRKAARRLGLVLVMLIVACNVYGILTGYTGYTYPPGERLYEGTLPMLAIVLMVPFSLLFLLSVRRKKTELAVVSAAASASAETQRRKPAGKRKHEPKHLSQTSAKRKSEKQPEHEAVPEISPRERAKAQYSEALRKYELAKAEAKKRENRE